MAEVHAGVAWNSGVQRNSIEEDPISQNDASVIVERCCRWPGAASVPRVAGAACSGRRGRSARAEAAAFSGQSQARIFLFMNGGMSQVDTFDPKSELTSDRTENPCPGPR